MTNTDADESPTVATFTLPHAQYTEIFVGDAMAVLSLVESIGAWLMANMTGYATLYAGPSFNFVQLLMAGEGALYIESSKAGDLAEQGEEGWDEKWEFCGGKTIGPHLGQERMAAEMLTRALVELHELALPGILRVYAEAAEGKPAPIERRLT